MESLIQVPKSGKVKGKTVETYIGFLSVDGRNSAISIFTGEVIVS